MSDVTYYWDERYASSGWDNYPDYMVDGILTNYAPTDSNGNSQLLFSTTCLGTNLGTITKVELRVYGYGDGNDQIELRFAPPTDIIHEITMSSSADWSSYIDVTSDPTVNGWTWAKISNLHDVQTDYLALGYDAVGIRCGW